MTKPVHIYLASIFVTCFSIVTPLLEMRHFSLQRLWGSLGHSLSCSVFCFAVLASAGLFLILLDVALTCEVLLLIRCCWNCCCCPAFHLCCTGILWSMASPWTCFEELHELALVWTHFLALLVHCSIFFLFFWPAEFLFFNFWHMSCKLVSIFAISLLVIVEDLPSVCLDWWLFANVVDLFGIPPGSGHGFLLSMACCWSGMSVVSFLDFERLCDVTYSEVMQSQSSFALFQAHDEIFFQFSLPEACARILNFSWICWFGLVSHLCCTGGNFFYLAFCVSCTAMCLPNFHPFSLVWKMCGSIEDSSVYRTSVFLGSFSFTCWVWRSVVQQLCPSGSSPGSSLGWLLNWACCRKDIVSFCLLFQMWLSVLVRKNSGST